MATLPWAFPVQLNPDPAGFPVALRVLGGDGLWQDVPLSLQVLEGGLWKVVELRTLNTDGTWS